jgi:hypothetical protein
VRLLAALKNGAESRSLQIRQIYAARQGDSARIWWKSRRRTADLWSPKATSGPPLTFSLKNG